MEQKNQYKSRDEEELFARRLALTINRFWQAKGFDAQADIVKVKFNSSEESISAARPPVFAITSKTINGMPLKKLITINSKKEREEPLDPSR